MNQIEIPNRPYFRIGQAARLLGVQTHVLRYWESRFPQIKPTRAPSGQRLYHQQDVRLLLQIKRLVHEEGYTLDGARRRLEEIAGDESPPDADGDQAQVLAELKDILKIIE